MKHSNHPNLVVFEKVLIYAEQIFRNKVRANQWLEKENGALYNKAPFDLMETEKGCNEVLEVLGRIEDGIYY